MDRAHIIERLKTLEPQLRARGVAALYLFGSYARDDAGPGSDVDLFVDPQDESFGIGRFAETSELVEQSLPGMDVGFSTRDSLVPIYLRGIENDAIRIF